MRPGGLVTLGDWAAEVADRCRRQEMTGVSARCRSLIYRALTLAYPPRAHHPPWSSAVPTVLLLPLGTRQCPVVLYPRTTVPSHLPCPHDRCTRFVRSPVPRESLPRGHASSWNLQIFTDLPPCTRTGYMPPRVPCTARPHATDWRSCRLRRGERQSKRPTTRGRFLYSEH